MDTNQKKFGRAIRARREAKGLSQEAFADHVGVHRVYMGTVERGEVNLTLANIEKIVAGLGLKIWEIMREADI